MCDSPASSYRIARKHGGLGASSRGENSSFRVDRPSVRRLPQVTSFLAHLSILLSRIPKSEYNEHIYELNDAVQKLFPAGSSSPNPPQADFHDITFIRSMLEDIAGKSLKSPSALEKEIRCDRFVTAYCQLKEAVERVENAERAIMKRATAGQVYDFRNYDIIATAADTEEEDLRSIQRSANAFMRSFGLSPKLKQQATVTSKLFFSPSKGTMSFL